VQGSVAWPDASMSATIGQGQRLLRANDLSNHPTGDFPVAEPDPAYQYDRNPNSIRAQQIVMMMPLDPQIAAQSACLEMGMIGFALSGAAIFNGLDAVGRDAMVGPAFFVPGGGRVSGIIAPGKGKEDAVKRKRFSVEQIVAVLKQAEMEAPVADLIRHLWIAEQTFYRWKQRYAGLESNRFGSSSSCRTYSQNNSEALAEAECGGVSMHHVCGE
jgi:hypothetical protein